ncbi:MAG: ABC transporter ATP-binding protein [Phycisphaerales bacterium]
MTLAAHELVVDLGSNRVLNGVDLSITPGEMVAIVGPNGSGKSTLLRALAGLLRPAAGGTTLDAKPLHRFAKRSLARRRGLLAQTADLPQLTTVREHVAMGRHAHTSPLATLFRSVDQATHNAAINAAMDRCGVAHLAERRMEALSGGERQRVRLATTLAQQPDILLLDEPLTGLDIEHQLGLLDLLSDLNTATGTTVVCVIHDLGLALRHFPRIVAVHEGRIAADGPGDRVLDAKTLRTVFGVEGCACFDLPGHPVVVCRSHSCGERDTKPEVVTPSLDRQPIPR